MNKTKLIKIAIIIVIIQIIVILGVLYYISNKKKNNATNFNNENNIEINNEEENIYVIPPIDDNTNKIERVKDNKVFYNVENCVKKYEMFINMNYNLKENELGQPSTAVECNINNEKDKKEAVLLLLDGDFINKNNINSNNIQNYINFTTNEDISVEALKINEIINDSALKIYSIYARKGNNVKKEDTYYIVKIAFGDVFSIYPLKGYNDIDDIKSVDNSMTNIEKNIRNSFVKIDKINEGQIATKYFQEYKDLLLNNNELAYNKLDINYKEKRYGNINEFIEYINQNKRNIELMQVYKYETMKENENCIYKVIDRYENVYYFVESYPKEYKVFLDNYTIMQTDYAKDYDNANKFGKAKYNLINFISMVNTKDFNAIYNHLDATFKQNNFRNVDELENNIKNNMYLINSVEINESNNSQYYVFKCKLINQENKDNVKDMTVVINQTDGRNFTMSFSF